MKGTFFTLLLLSLVSSSCNTVRGLFSKKTPHEKYAEKIEDSGLEKTEKGRQWLAASKAALNAPVPVTLPYRMAGTFPSDKARALGLRFAVKKGEQLIFTLSRKGAPFVLYADLFREGDNGKQLLHAADTSDSRFTYDVEDAGTYILRLQPELFRTGDYSLSVAIGPSLSFPVSGKEAKAGSFWGASRDGGKRSHEGIDIFAPKGTPAIAAADGEITAVREGGIGGKVVWLRPSGKSYTLYYAHLDEQLVHAGQEVKKGQAVGTVGNTGNARTTPSHLHFGIYTYSGPTDPYPFINPTVRSAPAVPKKSLEYYVRLKKTQKGAGASALQANALLLPLAVSATGYIIELPDGHLIQAPLASVEQTRQSPENGGKQNVATLRANR